MDQPRRKNQLIGSADARGGVGGKSWFRPDSARFFPDQNGLVDFNQSNFNFKNQEDFVQFMEAHILEGWAPPQPLFAPDAELLALGSCFARELQYAMQDRQKELKHLWMPAGLNNTFAMRQFIEWVLTGDLSAEAYWYDAAKEGGAAKWKPNADRKKYYQAFSKVDGFVMTLGLSEIWCDKKTKKVFWRGIPNDVFDPRIHEFRVSGVGENLENIERIVELIQTHFPGKPIIYTVSPVPLRATFRQISCLSADSVSKSILRVAVDELMRKSLPQVYYWPSFEAVRWVGAHIEGRTFGDAHRDSRHVAQSVVDAIITTFIQYFFKPGV